MKMENNVNIKDIVINDSNELFVILSDNNVVFICDDIEGGTLGDDNVIRIRIKNHLGVYHELRYNNGEFIELVKTYDDKDTVINRAVYSLEKLKKRMDELMREDKLFFGRVNSIIMRKYGYVLIPEIHYKKDFNIGKGE